MSYKRLVSVCLAPVSVQGEFMTTLLINSSSSKTYTIIA